MPVYDYSCTACGVTTEVVHGIHDGGPRFCPACGAAGTMKKDFTSPAVHFKGSGWAKKDRGSSARTKAAAKASGSSDSAAPGSGGASASSGGSASGDTSKSGGAPASDGKASSSSTSSSGGED